jgi:hypothetical protein
MAEPIWALDRCRSLPFGAAIELPDDRWAEPFDETLLEPRGAGFGEVPEGAEAGEIVFEARGFGQRPDAAHHGGDGVDGIDA